MSNPTAGNRPRSDTPSEATRKLPDEVLGWKIKSFPPERVCHLWETDFTSSFIPTWKRVGTW